MTGVLVHAGALGAGLVSGAFSVFSLVVMPALVAVPSPVGVAAMQSVNRTAIRPVFLTLLFGTAVLCLAAGGAELAGARRPGVLAAGPLYLVGVVGVTVAANVPLNDALARWRPDAAAPGDWTRWVRRWTWWNGVRALAAALAAVLLVGPA
ncbi:anthrone oxygenase family protein [Blastococcus sp. SYSU DS1021]